MKHDEIIAEIQDRAMARDIYSHYCRNSRLCEGDSGLPDLFLLGPSGAAWVEIKIPGDRLKPGQARWKYRLIAARQRHYVVGPAELADGRVDEILDVISDLPGKETQ